MTGDAGPAAGAVDVPARLIAAHAAIASLALVRLVETAERHGRLGELPAAVLDAMTVLPAAIQRWQGSEGEPAEAQQGGRPATVNQVAPPEKRAAASPSHRHEPSPGS